MNKVTLLGRLAKDPESRSTVSGTLVTNFTVAVDRRFKDASGNKQTDFINCVAWKQTADFISKYFSKGRMISVCGSIQTRTWDDKDGKKHYVTEVLVEEAYFTGDKPKDELASPNANLNNTLNVEGFVPFDDSSQDECPF